LITDQQRAARRFFIGSSDCAAACGIDPYKSRTRLWLEKTGRIEPEDLSENERVHFGNVLEPIVAAEFARRRQVSVTAATDTIFDGYRSANIDYYVDEPEAILECKTAGYWMRPQWAEGATPPLYRLQLEHQLMTRRIGIGSIACLIGGQEYVDRDHQADPLLQERIATLQDEFQRFVESDTPPPPESASDVLMLFPADNRQRVAAADNEIEQWTRLASLRKAARQLHEDADAILDNLQLRMLDNAELIDPADGRVLVRWQAETGLETDWQSVAARLAESVARNTYEQAVRQYSTPRKRRVWVRPTDITRGAA